MQYTFSIISIIVAIYQEGPQEIQNQDAILQFFIKQNAKSLELYVKLSSIDNFRMVRVVPVTAPFC